MHDAEVIKSLKCQGLKLTKLRLGVLSDLDHPVDVQTLVAKYSVNKTTVYRELKTLLHCGFISEVDFGDGKKRYERSDLGHHHHLICVKCQDITDVHLDSDLLEAEKRIEQDKNFKIIKHNLEFLGLCHKCNKI